MHTPGPWEWDEFSLTTKDKGDIIYPDVISDRPPIYRIVATNPDDLGIIAAAPDLLEALTNCLWLADLLSGNTDEIGNKIIAEARQAIKKAKGET